MVSQFLVVSHEESVKPFMKLQNITSRTSLLLTDESVKSTASISCDIFPLIICSQRQLKVGNSFYRFCDIRCGSIH